MCIFLKVQLSIMVQKWFPELPLMYSDAGILNHMVRINVFPLYLFGCRDIEVYTHSLFQPPQCSGGLLSSSMERILFDAEPMKELSNKRPLLCTEIQDKKVLLKVLYIQKRKIFELGGGTSYLTICVFFLTNFNFCQENVTLLNNIE